MNNRGVCIPWDSVWFLHALFVWVWGIWGYWAFLCQSFTYFCHVCLPRISIPGYLLKLISSTWIMYWVYIFGSVGLFVRWDRDAHGWLSHDATVVRWEQMHMEGFPMMRGSAVMRDEICTWKACPWCCTWKTFPWCNEFEDFTHRWL